MAVTVLVFTLVAVILAVALYVVVRLGLLVRHHVAHPETLTRHAIRAEVIPGKALPAAESPAVPAPAPVAAIAPPLARIVGMGRTWRPLDDPDTYRTAFPGTAGDAPPPKGNSHEFKDDQVKARPHRPLHRPEQARQGDPARAHTARRQALGRPDRSRKASRPTKMQVSAPGRWQWTLTPAAAGATRKEGT